MIPWHSAMYGEEHFRTGGAIPETAKRGVGLANFIECSEGGRDNQPVFVIRFTFIRFRAKRADKESMT
jgi:hypothetical protein